MQSKRKIAPRYRCIYLEQEGQKESPDRGPAPPFDGNASIMLHEEST